MASSFQQQPLTGEQVRQQYRERSRRADLEPAEIVGAVPDDPDNTMPKDKLNAPILFTIKEWTDRPIIVTPPGLHNKLTLEYQLEGQPWVQIGTTEEIGNTTVFPSSKFPLERELPLDAYKSHEGNIKIKYTVENWNDQNFRSAETSLYIDRTPPQLPVDSAMVFKDAVITDETLDADDGAIATIPDYTEPKKASVKVALVLMNRLPQPGEDLEAFVVYYGPLPASREVKVPKQAIIDLGSTTLYTTYFLFDIALNRGEMGLPTAIFAALGPLPTGLQRCSVPLQADGVVDRADGAMPTFVQIEEITNALNNDWIVVQWGNTKLPKTPVSAQLPWALEIPMPWETLAKEYDFSSATFEQTIKVDYEILRGDYAIPSPGPIDVKVNLAIPGPENPKPTPINDDLKKPRFESFSGSDKELTKADRNKDAKAFITLFTIPAPVQGQLLTLYYNNKAASSQPYTIKGDEAPGSEVEMTIPWADIDLYPVAKDLPLHWVLSDAGYINPQESPRTEIDVLVEEIDLPEMTFPAPVMNCTHLVKKGNEWGLYLDIPKSTYLVRGAEVVAVWNTFDEDGVTEFPKAYLVETIPIGDNEEQNGARWFIPYAKCLAITYRPPNNSGGIGQAAYSINVRGEDVASDVSMFVIGMFEPDGAGNVACKITP